ncbi:MAG: efflux RND transporter periplasmic adaptor subunit [Bacteroidetes bacterium]|nr:MAG: efflux RND transporter periplasmic adaptor subunit [Bacteroidota bacterium]
MRNVFKNKYVRFSLLILVGVITGWVIKPGKTGTSESSLATTQESQEKEQIWTCSMHPQIRRNEPGQCPICGMDLIPLNSESNSEGNPMAISMSETAMQLANVQTIYVTKRKPVKEVRMPGKVQADERNIFSQTSHIPGRIEQLIVNYTGEEVKTGQTLALIYSPELVTAEEELLEALKIKEVQPALFEAAKDKLRNWKLSESQIEEVITTGKIQDKFPVLSEVSGVVLKKRVNTGDYIMRGMPVFDIVDLSKVWILLDVYESDIQWIHEGDKVEFTVQSISGKTFNGNISFIDPVINPQSRVAKARIEFTNDGMKLKPEMFVTGTIMSELKGEKEGLVIPKSAVMWTGERSVVYVKNQTNKGVNFMMTEVVLGPSLGDSYVIKSGLSEGMEIASNGTFSIDASAQLAGKPSMMSPEGGVKMTGHNHGAPVQVEVKTSAKALKPNKNEKETIIPLVQEYLKLKDALVEDDFEKGKTISESLLNKIKGVEMNVFKGESHNIWMQARPTLIKSLGTIQSAENIGALRTQFHIVSEQFILLTETFGSMYEKLFVIHCPMANQNKGADWISNNKEVKNPYLGAEMISCGDVIKELK